jgi:hypothetical protein
MQAPNTAVLSPASGVPYGAWKQIACFAQVGAGVLAWRGPEHVVVGEGGREVKVVSLALV